MNHNQLYRLERSQKICLKYLAIAFLALSIIWFFIELFGHDFPMEPLVVFFGGFATLFASWWPFRASDKSSQLAGRRSFDYMTNDHQFLIGSGQQEFTLRFSQSGTDSIYMYNDPPDIDAIALVHGAGQFSDVADATCLDFRNRVLQVKEEQIVCLRNTHKNYALVRILDVKYKGRKSEGEEEEADRNEVIFSYAIASVGGTKFA